MDVWGTVVEDFDIDLDTPGEVSDRGIDALLARLGVSVPLQDMDCDSPPPAVAVETPPPRSRCTSRTACTTAGRTATH